MYLIQKTLNKLNSDGYSFFLNPNELKDVCNHLKKKTYHIFKPYEDSDKNIIYKDTLPDVILFEIETNNDLRHQDILGSLYSLKINDNLFGDIIITNHHYYFYTFQYLQSFFEMEYTKIRNYNIQLIRRDINLLKDYHQKYEELSIITSSLRIDSVIAKVIHTNRDKVKELIKDKNVIYNYEILKDNDKTLHPLDTFSIRKYGKYKFHSVLQKTKKDNYMIIIHKYISQ